MYFKFQTKVIRWFAIKAIIEMWRAESEKKYGINDPIRCMLDLDLSSKEKEFRKNWTGLIQKIYGADLLILRDWIKIGKETVIDSAGTPLI